MKALKSELSKYEETVGMITSSESPVIAKMQKKCRDGFHQAAQTDPSIATEPRLHSTRCSRPGCNKMAVGAGGRCTGHGKGKGKCEHVNKAGVRCKNNVVGTNGDGLKVCISHGAVVKKRDQKRKRPPRQVLCANKCCKGNNGRGNMAQVGGYCNRTECRALRGSTGKKGNSTTSRGVEAAVEAAVDAAEAISEHEWSGQQVKRFAEV